MKLVSFLAVLVLALSACGGSGGGGGDSVKTDQVEALIRSQIPVQASKVGLTVMVGKVVCIDKGDGTEYDCVASVGEPVAGKVEYTDLLITASCDSETCVWRTT